MIRLLLLRAAVCATGLAALAVIPAEGGQEDPVWALKLAAQPPPVVDQAADAVVLLDETEKTVSQASVATVVRRVVIRVLTTPGSRWAKGQSNYLVHAKVRSLGAWIIRDNAVAKFKSGADWLDISLMGGATVYSETRAKFIDLSGETTRGDVFAYETRVEEPVLVAQFQFASTWSIPVVKESVQLCVPAGFSFRTKTRRAFNTAPLLSAGGRCLTWTLTDLPQIPVEPLALDPGEQKPELLVAVVPLDGADRLAAHTFESWGDVSRWAFELGRGQCDTAPALQAKARELIGSRTDGLNKIRALAEYVQKIRYVAIDRDLGKGSGYKPRKATEVFAQGYGDCKDKANLLRSMLEFADIESEIAVVRMEEGYDIDPELPTPGQFNHAILAIKVDADVNLPAVAERGGERFLFFDATDPHTRLGDLPEQLQGTPALLITGRPEELLVLPRLTPAAGHAERRKARLTLVPEKMGAVTGTITVDSRGQKGAQLRALLFKASAPKDLEGLAASQLGEALRGAQLLERTKHDDRETDECGLSFTVNQDRFLQFLPDGVAIARFDVLSRSAIPSLSMKVRVSPVQLRPLSQEDEVALDLASSFQVEEMPAAIEISSPYGHYSRTFERSGTRVVMKRRLVLEAARVPVQEYPQLRQFFQDVVKADQVSVVLRQLAQ